MSASPENTARSVQSITEQTRRFFEPQLEKLLLGEEQIDAQTLEELYSSLERINDAIKNPDQFGVLRVAVMADGTIFIVKALTESIITVGVLPILLERKQRVLSRIRLIEGDRKITNIRDALDEVSDPEVKHKLENELNALEEQSRRFQRQSEQVQEASAEERLRTEVGLAKLRAELFERNSKVWRENLGKESVSTMLGGLLIIVIVLSQIAAFFFDKDFPDILNNTLLIVLGYFFGQSVVRAKSDP